MHAIVSTECIPNKCPFYLYQNDREQPHKQENARESKHKQRDPRKSINDQAGRSVAKRNFTLFLHCIIMGYSH